MAVFTKTYVQCDLCEAQRELPMSGEGFYRVEAQVSRLGAGASTSSDKVSSRTSDICQSCFGALQEGEWSNLFFGEKKSGPKPLSAV
jgi:hypothetical protein